MYFQQRSDFAPFTTQVATVSAIPGSASSPQEFRIPLQRTFPIEAIIVVIEGNVTAAAAALNVDGLQNLLKRINLTVADGVRTRTVVDMSGSDLLEFQAQTRGFIDADTIQRIGGVTGQAPAAYGFNASTSTFKMSYILDCCPTQIVDPLSSMFLLPVTRYPSDPVLTLTIAGGTDIDKGAVGTFNMTGIKVTVQVLRRFVNIDKWSYVDWDMTSQDTPLPSAINDQRIELLTPGSYLGTLYKCYCGTNSATLPLTRVDVTDANNPAVRIESLNVNFRRSTFSLMKSLNEASRGYSFLPNGTTQFFPASFYNDFLTDRLADAMELGSVLDANIPVNSGATVNLYISPNSNSRGANLTQANSFLRQIHWRAYGDLSSLKGIR